MEQVQGQQMGGAEDVEAPFFCRVLPEQAEAQNPDDGDAVSVARMGQNAAGQGNQEPHAEWPWPRWRWFSAAMR